MDMNNPLMAAARKKKSEQSKNALNKRKLQNGGDQSGGLLIVHAPAPAPRQDRSHSSQSTTPKPPSSSQNKPPSSSHPSKKFRASSQPPSQPQASTSQTSIPIPIDEDEQDMLRRQSRARQLDPAIRAGSYEFAAEGEPPGAGAKGKGKSKAANTTTTTTTRTTSMMVDTIQAIPLDESPMIARNKVLRSGSMAAIRAYQEQETEERRGRASVGGAGDGKKNGQGAHKRKSSISRGKRISASFEVSGSFPEPHKSVSHKSFFKHIDTDLPESERLRQLLTWTHSRTAQSPLTFSGTPEVSTKGQQALKDVWKDHLQKLANKEIDLSMPSSSSTQPSSSLQDNEQNASLRQWEKEYTNDIRRIEDEEQEWIKVDGFYDTFVKRERIRIEQRKTELETLTNVPSSSSSSTLPPLPSPELLPESQRKVVDVCRSLLQGDVGAGEEKTKKRFEELQYNLDSLHTYVNTARAATRVSERLLDRRFEVLTVALKARTGEIPAALTSSSSSSSMQILNEYLPARAGAGSSRNPQGIFKALSRVDSARPAGKRGDEVRRAERVLQRIGEAGGSGGVGERRLTLPPPPTPRKMGMPGTPRRGHTPGRDRERTPGR